MTTIRFGLNISTSAAPGSDPVGDALAAEALGFNFVSASDHPCGTSPTYETWTMLTWIAAATSAIGLATRVLGVPYRPPVMVAKMAATLDGLSDDRLILGLGGGYSDGEFRAFGLDVPSPREKVDGLEDAVRIARGMWSQPDLTYTGSRYHTAGAQRTEAGASHPHLSVSRVRSSPPSEHTHRADRCTQALSGRHRTCCARVPWRPYNVACARPPSAAPTAREECSDDGPDDSPTGRCRQTHRR